MNMPQSLTTVTRLSKILAAVLFITLPFAGFYLGMQYQKGITPVISDQNSSQVPTIRVPSITSDPTEDWKTYTIDDSLQFKYPQSYSIFANQGKIIIKSPISICNPKLTFNLEEYGELNEVQIILKIVDKPLVAVLNENGGQDYGWTADNIFGKTGYTISIGAEMIIPVTKYLVEINPGKTLVMESNTFGSDDQGRCTPKLSVTSATRIDRQIRSTFRFINNDAVGECIVDSDCGFDTCHGCKVYPLSHIKEIDRTCKIFCSGKPRCAGNKCIREMDTDR